MLAVVGAVAIIAAAVGVWRYSQPGDDLSVASSGGTVVTRYERVEYTQHATLNCPDGQLPDVGFDHSTLEAWADVDGNRWRNTVTYPDGSTRDLIAIGGSPWYPDELYSRGDRHGHPLGCNNLTIGVVVDEPSAHSFFSLNPLAQVPQIPSTELSTPLGTATVPAQSAVPSYRELGTLIDGNHTDSQGRTADLWRQTVTGFMTGTSGTWPVTQTTEWFVDPASGSVLEKTYTDQVDQIGTASWTQTLVSSSSITVAADLFDSTGYEQVTNPAAGNSSVTTSTR